MAKQRPSKAQRADAAAKEALALMDAQITQMEASLRCLKLAAKDLRKRVAEQAITEGENAASQTV